MTIDELRTKVSEGSGISGKDLEGTPEVRTLDPSASRDAIQVDMQIAAAQINAAAYEISNWAQEKLGDSSADFMQQVYQARNVAQPDFTFTSADANYRDTANYQRALDYAWDAIGKAKNALGL